MARLTCWILLALLVGSVLASHADQDPDKTNTQLTGNHLGKRRDSDSIEINISDASDFDEVEVTVEKKLKAKP